MIFSGLHSKVVTIEVIVEIDTVFHRVAAWRSLQSKAPQASFSSICETASLLFVIGR